MIIDILFYVYYGIENGHLIILSRNVYNGRGGVFCWHWYMLSICYYTRSPTTAPKFPIISPTTLTRVHSHMAIVNYILVLATALTRLNSLSS